MRLVLVILLLVRAAFSLSAQDLTGQWTGRSLSKTADNQQKYTPDQKLVLDISASDSLFGGVMHWYYPDTQGFDHVIVSGRFHGDSVVSLMEDGRSADSRGDADRDPTGMYILHYKRIGHREVLEGHWKGVSKNDPGKYRGSAIRLERKAGPLLPPLPVIEHHRKDSAQQQQWLSLLSRTSPVAATIHMEHEDSVELELYDNGEIDGDSVSLYMNGQLVVSHLKLDSRPMVMKLALDKSLPVNKLILYAENLGILPPNTALMEINTRGKKYNIFLSTDFRRNAMVEFALTE